MAGLSAGIARQGQARTDPRFRVIDLGEIGFTPDVERQHGSMGINNCGQVVYAYYSGGQFHPFIWLPADAFGLDFGVRYSLEDLDEDPHGGIARDINSAGLIVGQAGTGVYGTAYDQICVWEFDGMGAVASNLQGTLSAYSINWSGGNAINDDSPPLVVGVSASAEDCDCPPNPLSQDADIWKGCKVEYDGSPTVILLESATGSVNAAIANDVLTPGTVSLEIGGASFCTDCPGEEVFTDCQAQRNARYWTTTTTGAAVTDLSAAAGSFVRGLCDRGHAVGWAKTEPEECLRKAYYWYALPGTSPYSLGSLLTSGHGSRAEAINNLENPQVVGWDETTDTAVLWEYNGSSWSAYDLNSTASIGNDLCGKDWTIRQAHDINDSGWIAAIATLPGSPSAVFHAVLLVPWVACPGDATCDGIVNYDDLSLVLGSWGACSAPCPADVAPTYGVVDIDDLLYVTNHWGVCVELPSCSQDQQRTTYNGDEEDPAEFILNALAAFGVPTEFINAIQALIDP